MGAQSIFIKILAALIICNFIFYMVGWNANLLTASSIVGIFVAIVIIGLILAFVPTTSEGSYLKWLSPTAIVLLILYQVDILSVLTGAFGVVGILLYFGGLSFPVGIGLVTNLTNLCSNNSNNLSYMPWLLFNFLGIICLICGILAATGGGD